ncbi:nucleolar protein 7 [Hyla sarda]|uniref:nucleolar protein 7 n=1 Tax=Hyla sarda TaxID=327740 RepID=UPI0024C2EEF0|nr:nucleolar protein 7 [Hyla sarda]
MTPEHELESEEDDAPEEVTFQSAKSQAQESARARREAVIREKALLKEKRKRKEELFKEQKKKKLLSDDILQSITSHPEKREEANKQHEEKKTKGNEGTVGKKHVKKVLPRKRLQNNYQVVQLEEYSSRNLLQQRAKSFIRGKLYGKNKNRTTASEFLSLSRKTSFIKKPAVQFVDHAWDEEMKAKAEKFNLQWAHRKKL